MKDELDRRRSHVEQLRELFEASPNVWIPAIDLERPGGRQAWRTRTSELRQRLERENAGTIENRYKTVNGAVVSEYRYLPHKPLGRDAGEYRAVNLFDLPLDGGFHSR